MSNPDRMTGGDFACDCCPRPARSDSGHAEHNRRDFLIGAGGLTAAGVTFTAMESGAADPQKKPPRQQPIRLPLRVQPVFNCEIYPRKEATSWRVTGAIQDEQELREEEAHIRRDLGQMASAAEFALEILPLITVREVDQAAAAAKGNQDVTIMYAARRNRPLLEALAAPDKWNLMFVRHRSGPLYYMYIGAHTHFLRKTRDEFGQSGMDVRDVVVDDHAEVLWRLRALAGLKNAMGRRIVAVGGPGGWGEGGKGAPSGPRRPGRWTSARRPMPNSASGSRRPRRIRPSSGAAAPKPKGTSSRRA